MNVVSASIRVQRQWQDRIAAEYTSAAHTQNLVLWLMQLGAPPDLIDAGLAVVADELAHSRLSHEVYLDAGGHAPPAIEAESLALVRDQADLHYDVLRVVVREFCLGETVAVPLFVHLRERCDRPSARAALDRIVRDEVRHRELGWDLLDWLQQASPIAAAVAGWVAAALPGMLVALDRNYGRRNPAVASGDDGIDDDDRRWGLAPAREYAEILLQTAAKEFRPRFTARGIVFAEDSTLP